ncbi:unnamed protein product [Linum trigynum]|uniref:Uncharacterized protein n=1 Tax=Linum trigynum TaxID=586398 RepID=A0AAV2E9T7_9ROSI
MLLRPAADGDDGGSQNHSVQLVPSKSLRPTRSSATSNAEFPPPLRPNHRHHHKLKILINLLGHSSYFRLQIRRPFILRAQLGII